MTKQIEVFDTSGGTSFWEIKTINPISKRPLTELEQMKLSIMIQSYIDNLQKTKYNG